MSSTLQHRTSHLTKALSHRSFKMRYLGYSISPRRKHHQFSTHYDALQRFKSRSSSAPQNTLKKLRWTRYVYRSPGPVDVPDPTSHFLQLREILDQSSMTRLLGPGSSVFAAPHSGFAVWDKAIEGVKPGTIGRSFKTMHASQ